MLGKRKPYTGTSGRNTKIVEDPKTPVSQNQETLEVPATPVMVEKPVEHAPKPTVGKSNNDFRKFFKKSN